MLCEISQEPLKKRIARTSLWKHSGAQLTEYRLPKYVLQKNKICGSNVFWFDKIKAQF